MNEREGFDHPVESQEASSFQTRLTELTEQYADASYITYGANVDLASVEQKRQQSEQLYRQLLEIAVEALNSSKNREQVVDIIDQTLLDYRYEAGPTLFSQSQKAEFYRALVLESLKKK